VNNSLSIAKRLYLMLGTALLGLMLIGGLDFARMNSVFDITNQGNVKTVPSLLVLGRAIDEFGQLRAHTTQHVLSADDTGKAEIDKLIRADREKMEKSFKEYAPATVNTADQKLQDEFRANLDAYFAGVAKTLELSSVNLFDEARAQILLNAANEARLRDSFAAQLKLGEAQAKKVAQEGQSEIVSATWTSILIAIVLAGVVGAMGIVITNALVKQLKLAAHVADTVTSPASSR